jgi:hypothetical protein
MIDLAGATAIIALSWTIYQQYRINEICRKCPYFPPNKLN